MVERVRRELADVLRNHVVAPADQCQRPGGGHQRDRPARARSEGDVRLQVGEADRLRVARRSRDPHRVARQGGIDIDPANRLAKRDERVQVEDLTNLGHAGQRALDHRQLVLGLGVADDDLEHEPVDLSLGQRVGALRLNRVLGRHHEERARRRERLLADRDLALLHDFEQGGLHLRRRAVDLVGEQEVAEDGPELDVEVTVLRPVDPGADEVARHQVRGELDPVERPAQHLGGRLDRQRLRETRDAFDEQVAVRQEADEDSFEHRVLPGDDALDLEQGAFQVILALSGRKGLFHVGLLLRVWLPTLGNPPRLRPG